MPEPEWDTCADDSGRIVQHSFNAGSACAWLRLSADVWHLYITTHDPEDISQVVDLVVRVFPADTTFEEMRPLAEKLAVEEHGHAVRIQEVVAEEARQKHEQWFKDHWEEFMEQRLKVELERRVQAEIERLLDNTDIGALVRARLGLDTGKKS